MSRLYPGVCLEGLRSRVADAQIQGAAAVGQPAVKASCDFHAITDFHTSLLLEFWFCKNLSLLYDRCLLFFVISLWPVSSVSAFVNHFVLSRKTCGRMQMVATSPFCIYFTPFVQACCNNPIEVNYKIWIQSHDLITFAV